MNRLTCGIGVNDTNYIGKKGKGGKENRRRYYSVWESMLTRCYSEKYKVRRPTYLGCTVCDEWLTFSNFKSWMERQDWEGKDLDKDILKRGNKVYSPSTCVFVGKNINNILQSWSPKKSPYSQGVTFDKRRGVFNARVGIKGKCINIGTFCTEIEAADAYNCAKSKYLYEVASEQVEPLKSALFRHSDYYAMKTFYDNR